MKTRETASKILFILALPLVFLGLIDPLEGGLALIAAVVLYLVGFLLARKLPKRSLWLPFALSVLVGLVVIVLAITGESQTAQAELNLELRIGLWLYRGLVVITLVGAVLNAVRFLRRPA